MSIRLAKLAFCACCLAVFAGCVEITQTYTLNPDGRGKLKLEILIPAYDFDMAMGNGPDKKKEKSLDELRKDALAKFVADSAGVTAWKDVSVTWSRDGRLRMVGTAYFANLEDLDKKAEAGDGNPFKPPEPSNSFKSSMKMVRQSDGTLRLTGKNEGFQGGFMKLKGKGEGEAKAEVDVSKLSDKELEDFLLRQRVEYQKVKPLMVMMFGDLKLKTVLYLPGETLEVKGFKKEGETLMQSIEGNALLKMFQEVVMMDAAGVRKFAGAKNANDLFALIAQGDTFAPPDVTIKGPGKALFDYDQEVRDARAAYPALRKALGVGEEFQLPGETK